MARRMMRYVLPVGDLELEIPVRGGDNLHLSNAPDGHIYLYIEEDDDLAPETAIFRMFETGEAVDGYYVGTLDRGKIARHLYWVNAYEGARYAAFRGDVRGSDEVPEMHELRSSDVGGDTSGQGQDV